MAARRDSSLNAVALWILAVVAAAWFLRTAKDLLIPIALAVLISYALEPIVAWLAGRRIPRAAGAALVMLSLLAAGGWGAYAVKDDVASAIETLPETARRARERLLAELGSGADAVREAAGELGTTGGAASSQGSGAESAAGTSGQAPPGGAGSLLQQGVGSIFALAGHAVVVFFLIFFLLLSGGHVKRRLVEVAGPDPERRRVMAAILGDINAQIQRYLLVLLLTAAIVGLATWMVLAWMGVRNAAVWGALAGAFNSIPYFGPVIVSGGLLVVGLVQGGGVTQALQMSGAAIVITSLEGWLLTPPLMGKAERMSALAVFLGLLVWTWLWGAWGMLLAVPMLVVIKSVADRVERLKPVGRLMAP